MLGKKKFFQGTLKNRDFLNHLAILLRLSEKANQEHQKQKVEFIFQKNIWHGLVTAYSKVNQKLTFCKKSTHRLTFP